jgi:hypothetical protein
MPFLNPRDSADILPPGAMERRIDRRFSTVAFEIGQPACESEIVNVLVTF